MGGKLLVSLDFELFWGMLDRCALEDYQDNVMGGRTAIPELLNLFEKYDIHATWATVGFLFAENHQELKRYFPDQQPSYDQRDLSPYNWFEKIGEDENTAPCFYGASLVRLISEAPGQEIASHTFCHYYCREKGQTPEQFAADMQAAKQIAADHGYDLTSVILPRNQCEPAYTQVFRDLGFTAYRDEENDWIHERVKIQQLMRILRLADVYFPLTGQGGYIPKKEDGIWNLVGSRMYKPIFSPLGFLERQKIRRIKAQMRHAAKHDLTFHLWWHPHNIGIRTQEHLQQLEEIFCYFRQLKETYGMESLNMKEAALRMEQERESDGEKT